MSRKVTVEELIAHTREYLADVRGGETLTIVDGGRPIAIVEPSAPLRVLRHDPALRLQDFEPPPAPKNLTSDAASLIIEERERERGETYLS